MAGIASVVSVDETLLVGGTWLLSDMIFFARFLSGFLIFF
jgi:hypothetical protein